jgi:lipoate-protein ligase A
MWSQTPQFTLKLQAFDGVEFDVNVHHGVIKALDNSTGRNGSGMVEKIREALVDKRLQDIGDWNTFLRNRIQPWDEKCEFLAEQLEELLPIPKMRGV